MLFFLHVSSLLKKNLSEFLYFNPPDVVDQQKLAMHAFAPATVNTSTTNSTFQNTLVSSSSSAAIHNTTTEPKNSVSQQSS